MGMSGKASAYQTRRARADSEFVNRLLRGIREDRFPCETKVVVGGEVVENAPLRFELPLPRGPNLSQRAEQRALAKLGELEVD